MSVPVPSTPTNPADDDLREQAKRAVSRAALFDGPATTDEERERRLGVIADAVGEQVYAPVLEGLRRERDAARLWNKAHETNNAALGQTNRELAAERDALSSLLRGMARGVGQMRRVLTELAGELPCGWCNGTGIAPEERFGRDGDGAPMVDGDQPCPEGCRPSVSDQTPTTPDDAVQTAVVADLRERAERYRDRCVGKPSDGAHAFAAQVLDHLAMGYEIALPEPTAPSSVQGDTTPDDLAEQFPELANARVRFWVCPVHRELTDDRGRQIATVEWRGGIAHCTTGDCQITSATPAPSEGDTTPKEA